MCYSINDLISCIDLSTPDITNKINSTLTWTIVQTLFQIITDKIDLCSIRVHFVDETSNELDKLIRNQEKNRRNVIKAYLVPPSTDNRFDFESSPRQLKEKANTNQKFDTIYDILEHNLKNNIESEEKDDRYFRSPVKRCSTYKTVIKATKSGTKTNRTIVSGKVLESNAALMITATAAPTSQRCVIRPRYISRPVTTCVTREKQDHQITQPLCHSDSSRTSLTTAASLYDLLRTHRPGMKKTRVPNAKTLLNAILNKNRDSLIPKSSKTTSQSQNDGDSQKLSSKTTTTNVNAYLSPIISEISIKDLSAQEIPSAITPKMNLVNRVEELERLIQLDTNECDCTPRWGSLENELHDMRIRMDDLENEIKRLLYIEKKLLETEKRSISNCNEYGDAQKANDMPVGMLCELYGKHMGGDELGVATLLSDNKTRYDNIKVQLDGLMSELKNFRGLVANEQQPSADTDTTEIERLKSKINMILTEMCKVQKDITDSSEKCSSFYNAIDRLDCKVSQLGARIDEVKAMKESLLRFNIHLQHYDDKFVQLTERIESLCSTTFTKEQIAEYNTLHKQMTEMIKENYSKFILVKRDLYTKVHQTFDSLAYFEQLIKDNITHLCEIVNMKLSREEGQAISETVEMKFLLLNERIGAVEDVLNNKPNRFVQQKPSKSQFFNTLPMPVRPRKGPPNIHTQHAQQGYKIAKRYAGGSHTVIHPAEKVARAARCVDRERERERLTRRPGQFYDTDFKDTIPVQLKQQAVPIKHMKSVKSFSDHAVHYQMRNRHKLLEQRQTAYGCKSDHEIYNKMMRKSLNAPNYTEGVKQCIEKQVEAMTRKQRAQNIHFNEIPDREYYKIFMLRNRGQITRPVTKIDTPILPVPKSSALQVNHPDTNINFIIGDNTKCNLTQPIHRPRPVESDHFTIVSGSTFKKIQQ